MKTQLMKGASFVTAILLFSTMFSVVLAAPPLPFERYGTADVNSTYITSWIDGVEYGNTTTSAAGAYTIDTVGDDTVEDNVQTGGDAGNTIQYARSSLTGTSAYFFTQTDTWSAGGSTSGALTSEGSPTNLLKIAIFNPQPTVAVMGDYIALYNPTGAAVDVTGTGWGIAIGTGATHPIVTADIMPKLTSGNIDPIPATSLLYLNLSTAGWATSLSTTGNSIKLYYNTHVVDRVEYGSIGTAPENTMMSNAALPAAGSEAYRTATYATDTNMCLVDFGTRVQTISYDPTAPTSSCTVAGAYWRNTSPITIAATASDNVAVASVQLYFRYSADNVTFNAWAATGAPDTTSPYSFSFDFTANGGQGYFEFYTRATDTATPANVEAAPASADVRYGYDTTAPASQCTVAGAYWRNTSPITIAATASDALSGVASVQLYFRYSADNVTFNAWAATGTPDTTSPYSFSFDFTANGGTGYYEFYTRATDRATNVEAAPASADVRYRYNPVGATATATGPVSGWTNIAAVTITYSYTLTPTSVNIYYTTNGGATWTLAGNDASVNGNYGWTCPADGQYGWIASAVGGGSVELSPPTAGTAQEAGTYDYDGTAPIVEAGADMSAAGAKADATANSAISGTATILWTSAPVGVTFTPNNALATTVSAAAGVYTCTLTVTDAAGNIGSDFFTLTIGGGNPPPQVDDLNATHYGAGSTGILLQWTAQAGATSYVVYRTTSLNGTWGWAQIAEVATLNYNDTTAYSDNNNYSWVVHSKNTNGENMTKINSIAVKCVYAFAYSAAVSGGNANRISLPYILNMTSLTGTKNDARALKDDITSNVPGVTCSAVAWWDPTFGTRTWLAGPAFALVPGRSYAVTINGPGNYKIVGAYGPTPVVYPLAYSSTVSGGNSERLSLPYNMHLVSLTLTVNDARALKDNVTAFSGATCSAVAWWDPTFGTRTWLAGPAFALVPGRGYAVTINGPGAWSCPVYLPGP